MTPKQKSDMHIISLFSIFILCCVMQIIGKIYDVSIIQPTYICPYVELYAEICFEFIKKFIINIRLYYVICSGFISKFIKECIIECIILTIIAYSPFYIFLELYI